MGKRTQPYVWVVAYRHVPGMDRLESVAFDQKEDAQAFARAEQTRLNRPTLISRVLYQSEIDRRVDDYRMLVAMGIEVVA